MNMLLRLDRNLYMSKTVLRYFLSCRVYLLLILFCLFSKSAFAAIPQGVSVSVTPEWAEIFEISTDPSPSPHSDNGIDYLYHSRQVSLGKSADELPRSFVRNAWRFANSSGVADRSSFSVTFNPAYETIEIHAITIHRDGIELDKLDESRLTLLHKESDSEYLMYNGEKDLDVLISDVRVGDVLEYSYTITGENPVFAGQSEIVFRTNWGIYIERVDYRVSAPQSRELFIRKLNEEAAVEITQHQDQTDYRISLNQIIPLARENDTPDWYSPNGYIVISEFANWKDVADWERPIYEKAIDFSDDVKQLAVSLTQNYQADEERLVAALQWVQNEVRYLALSLGESTHVPSNPSVTLDRRFGDCKDKTVLLISLLRQMGFEAYPALVNTNYGKKLDDHPFRLHAFDHVLVYVQYKGKNLWLDPTMTYQKGQLGEFEQPDFGYALVLQDSADSLTAMENKTGVWSMETLSEFHLSHDENKAGAFTVTTKKNGPSAESERNYFATESTRKINESYEDYYSQLYGRVSLDRPIQLTENIGSGTVKTESYVIDKFFVDGHDSDGQTFVYADTIQSWLETPNKDQDREAPYKLYHPVKLTENVIINTPFALQNHTESVEEDNSFFKYTRVLETNPSQNTVTIAFTYESKTDHVNPADFEAYGEAINRVYYDGTYDVTSHQLGSALATFESEVMSKAQLAWSLILFLILSTGAMIYGILSQRSAK